MRGYRIDEIAGIVNAEVLRGDLSCTVLGATSDSRKVSPGDLFCALRGERADGHDFVFDVFKKGAGAAFIERHVPGLLESLESADPDGRFAVLMVPSTVSALQSLASSYRSELQTTFIGITGSVGKTSTKDLICSVLRTGFPTYGNPGNLNSHVGLPLALLGIDEAPKYAVLEMAMRAKGEITELCRIARPKFGILTDISMSHVGVLGSVEEIASAKSEILYSLPDDGHAVVSYDSEWVRKVVKDWGHPCVSYGLSEGCDIRGVGTRSLGEDGSTFRVILGHRMSSYDDIPEDVVFRLKTPGIHQVHNALCAVATGLLCGIPYEKIRDGLENAAMSPMRLQVIKASGKTIINDAYNASPKSMRSALDLLEECEGTRKIAILGDMLEMGDYGPEAHQEIGRYARAKATHLLTHGELSKQIVDGWGETEGPGFASWYSRKEELIHDLADFLQEGDAILVKASRSMGFESIVVAITGGVGVGHDGH